jgi:hypothetical protein
MTDNLRNETIYEGGNCPITAEIDRSSDPGSPAVRLECGCNEFWLDVDQARAVLSYLARALPVLERGGEDG